MLKTHAARLRALLLKKERHHNPDLRVDVVEGVGRSDYCVAVEANQGLINSIMDSHTSSEYLDDAQQRRERVGLTKMRFK